VGGQESVLPASLKLGLVALIGLGVGLIASRFVGVKFAPLIGWDTAVLLYLASTWSRILKYSGNFVKQHALREDPSRTVTDVVLLGASIASLGGVIIILLQTTGYSGLRLIGHAALGLVSVVVSWVLVHTVFALRYAELYYRGAHSAVDFGDTKSPTYADFAYLAFTIGMTFQLSDTSVRSSQLRQVVLKHALLSYLFGTTIIAATINLITGLGK
jgi:uncharacterized membrane protein